MRLPRPTIAGMVGLILVAAINFQVCRTAENVGSLSGITLLGALPILDALALAIVLIVRGLARRGGSEAFWPGFLVFGMAACVAWFGLVATRADLLFRRARATQSGIDLTWRRRIVFVRQTATPPAPNSSEAIAS